jgi:hypothetical protein
MLLLLLMLVGRACLPWRHPHHHRHHQQQMW